MAWMGLGSIIAIIGIVIVAGSIIAVIGKLLLNTFEGEHKSSSNRNADIVDYQQYKQLEAGNTISNEYNNEYNFEQINLSKAKQEKELLDSNQEEANTIAEELKDTDLEEIENRLKSQVEEENKEPVEDLDFDDIDVMSIVDEISDDVVEAEKEIANENAKQTIDPVLANLNIDDYLNNTEEEEIAKEVEEEEVQEINETEEIEPVEEIAEDIISEVEEEIVEEEIVDQDVLEEVVEEIADEIVNDEVKEDVVEVENSSKLELLKANEQIEILKAQLQEVNSKLEEARNSRPAVTIDMTEEECLARLAILEDRLKNVKKDYKINQKEYKPLKKIMKDYERYQTKLRRKDAVVAKKKVDLYGVNNYVDIDKEKAEKLANELELLDGLRLSVSHCEEVINANKERFPILEHTNKILEDQIAHIESDIEVTNITLQRIRDKKGSGDSQNGENQE